MAKQKPERLLLADAAVQLQTTPAALYARAVRGELGTLERDDRQRWTLPRAEVEKAAREMRRAARRG